MKPDIYVWKARRSVILLAVLPPTLAVLAWFPDADWKLLLPVLTFFGLIALVGQLGRDRGKAKEHGLFESWGGKPTTIRIRHRGSPFDPVTLERLHTLLETATGIPAPSKRKEGGDSAGADQVYDAYVRHLRDATRDKAKYPLVFDENVSYGFRRNLWGIRTAGAILAAVGMIGSAVPILLTLDTAIPPVAVAATSINAVLLILWCFWFNRNWVRIAAEAYADRLFEAALAMTPRKSEAEAVGKAEVSPPEE